MLDQTDASDEEEPYYYSQPIGDLRVLMLDSRIPIACTACSASGNWPGSLESLLRGRRAATWW